MLYNEGFFPFLVLFASAFVHELGHLAALRYFGYSPRRVDILPMGALIVCPEGMSYRQELAVAISGPSASFFCAVICIPVFLLTHSAYALFAILANIILCLVNLLPVKKLDGGKALACALLIKKEKETAERICSAVSVICFILFIFAACLASVSSGFNLGACISAAAVIAMML